MYKRCKLDIAQPFAATLHRARIQPKFTAAVVAASQSVTNQLSILCRILRLSSTRRVLVSLLNASSTSPYSLIPTPGMFISFRQARLMCVTRSNNAVQEADSNLQPLVSTNRQPSSHLDKVPVGSSRGAARFLRSSPVQSSSSIHGHIELTSACSYSHNIRHFPQPTK